MTPDLRQSPQRAFSAAAKKNDVCGMRSILSACPEHMSPITATDLFVAFNEALRDNRMETAEFLLNETLLQESMPSDVLTAQAQHYGRSINTTKVR